MNRRWKRSPGPRSGPGDIAVAGFRSTGSLAAWDAPGGGVGRSVDEAADLRGPTDDGVLEGRELVLGALGDLALVIVERRQEDAVVGQRADVVLATEVALGAGLEEVQDG